MSALLSLRGVTVRYRESGARRQAPPAVEGVSLDIRAGEILGLVGESGCGKSSLGRAILGLVPLAAGAVNWQGRRIDRLPAREFRKLRRELQCVFQDPYSSFDPRMTIAEAVAEPLRALRPDCSPTDRAARAAAQLADVGLAPELAGRYPHQLSGGQLQRAVLARALVMGPRFLVCDEPVSALDVPVQGEIIELLAHIRREQGLAGLFISHNLAVVAGLCERVLVMYRGRIVESASRQDLMRRPLHPYTRELLDAVPAIDAGARARLLRRAPRPAPAADESLAAPGCPFAPRCPHALPRCHAERPALQPAGASRLVACHRAAEWPEGLPAAGG